MLGILLLTLFTTWSYSTNRITIVNSGIINFKWEDYSYGFLFNVTFGFTLPLEVQLFYLIYNLVTYQGTKLVDY
jgi:hypothetical protein